MKTVLTLALLASSTVAMASNVSLKDSKNLPQISNSGIVVKQGPGFAAVEPTVLVKFSYVSCGTMEFSAKTTETKDLLLVAVQLDTPIDCMALGISREYTVQVASTRVQKPIVILNPVAPVVVAEVGVPQIPEDRFQICTMDAGVMFNPETGKCVGYFNGCVRAELSKAGFTFAQPGQCENVEPSFN